MNMYCPVDMRSCLWHPRRPATIWSGHVHIDTPIGDLMATVGLCADCHKWEHDVYSNNGAAVAAQNGLCVGCYGVLAGTMR